jgi:hypothetical protein
VRGTPSFSPIPIPATREEKMRVGTKTIREGDLVGDLVEGAFAGIAVTWAMGQVTAYLSENQAKRTREAEDDAREGRTACGVGGARRRTKPWART